MENLNSIKAYNASKNSPKNNNKSIINLNFDKNDSVQLSGHTINESFLNQLLFSNSQQTTHDNVKKKKKSDHYDEIKLKKIQSLYGKRASQRLLTEKVHKRVKADQ